MFSRVAQTASGKAGLSSSCFNQPRISITAVSKTTPMTQFHINLLHAAIKKPDPAFTRSGHSLLTIFAAAYVIGKKFFKINERGLCQLLE